MQNVRPAARRGRGPEAEMPGRLAPAGRSLAGERGDYLLGCGVIRR
jgi:hypothetical protein